MELCNATNYAYKNAFTIQFLLRIQRKVRSTENRVIGRVYNNFILYKKENGQSL